MIDGKRKSSMLEHMIRETKQYGTRNAEELECIHIVFGVDKNFVYPMGLAMTSILQHNQNVVFHVFIDDFPPPEDEMPLRETIERYGAVCRLYVVDTTLFQAFPTTSMWSAATYFRFCVTLFHGCLSRVLYLDGDTFCRGSLQDLFFIDLGGNAIGAVEAVFLSLEERQMNERRMQSIGLPIRQYFNAGVLLIDIDRWHDLSVTETAFEALRKNPERWQGALDQDLLNMLFQGRVLWLDSKYNTMRSDIRHTERDSVIVHYAGAKPWWAWYINSRSIYDAEYSQLLRTSAWKGKVIMPRNATECRLMARKCFHDGAYMDGLCWQMRYFKRKLFN